MGWSASGGAAVGSRGELADGDHRVAECARVVADQGFGAQHDLCGVGELVVCDLAASALQRWFTSGAVLVCEYERMRLEAILKLLAERGHVL